MDYVKPYGVVESMLAGGALKLSLSPRQLLLRGMLAGAYLGIGTSMAVTVAVETGYWIIGSILFPFGLALAILLGAEIITGSFALLPCAAVAGQKNAGLPRQRRQFEPGIILGSPAQKICEKPDKDEEEKILKRPR